MCICCWNDLKWKALRHCYFPAFNALFAFVNFISAVGNCISIKIYLLFFWVTFAAPYPPPERWKNPEKIIFYVGVRQKNLTVLILSDFSLIKPASFKFLDCILLLKNKWFSLLPHSFQIRLSFVSFGKLQTTSIFPAIPPVFPLPFQRCSFKNKLASDSMLYITVKGSHWKILKNQFRKFMIDRKTKGGIPIFVSL